MRRRIALSVFSALVLVTAVLGATLGWRQWQRARDRTLIGFAPPPLLAVEADEPLAPDERSLGLVGDVMLGRNVAGIAERKHVPFDALFDGARPFLAGVDVAFANLESPITDRGARKDGHAYAFRAPPEAAAALRGAGLDVVSLANNHALDYHADGLEDCVRRVRDAGLLAVGVGDPRGPQEPVIVDARGVTVGFLAYCDPRSPKGCNGRDRRQLPRPYRATDAALERDIAAARPQVDVLVVSLHWGSEGQEAPEARQVELGRHIIDLGADVVAGHHPHAQQPAELYGRGVILYSMGNFVFDQYARARFTEARFFRIIVAKGGVRRAAYLPLQFQKGVWQPRPTADSLIAVTALHRVP